MLFCRLNQIFKSNNAKILLSNFAWLSVLQVASYIFPLVTMPYLAKVIGVIGFGKIAFAASIIVWVQTITDWGFHFTATRDIAKCRHDIVAVSKIFSTVFWARLLLALVSFFILLSLVIVIPKFKENATIIFVTFLMIPGHILYPDWLFQALEKMKYTTLINVFSKLLFTIAVFLFVKDENDYIIQPLLTSIGYIISGVIAFIIIKKWGIRLHRISISDIISSLKNSFDVFFNNLMPNFYNSFSTILLGVICGNTYTGLLDAGSKFINIGQQFLNIISRTFYPFLARRIDKHGLYIRINLLASCCFSILLFTFSDLIIRVFFSSEFMDAVPIMRTLSLSIPFLALSNIYGTNYLILIRREKALRQVTTIVSVMGLMMAWPLISCFNSLGAAINVTMTRIVLGISITICAHKYKQLV